MSVIENNPESVFLSIHQNYFTQQKYNGAQVFYSPNNPESKLIADEIQKAIVADIQPGNTRQIKESTTDIYLLYHAKAPAVMVECGFLSNKVECEKLSEKEYQKELSFSIFCGIIEYIEKIS